MRLHTRSSLYTCAYKMRNIARARQYTTELVVRYFAINNKCGFTSYLKGKAENVSMSTSGPDIIQCIAIVRGKQWRWCRWIARGTRKLVVADSTAENFVGFETQTFPLLDSSLASEKRKASASKEQWTDLTFFQTRANLCSAQDRIMFHASVTNGR